MKADVFLTGGSGLVGGHLLRTLVGEGSNVRALARSDAAADSVSIGGATAVRGDVFDRLALTNGMAGAEVVFHVAGVNDTCPEDPSTMDRVNVVGTRTVMRAAAEAGVPRIVYTSSAAAIGEARGTIGTEQTTHSGQFVSAYARSKYLAEAAAFEEAERLGIDLVSVNPSSVQGPGRSTGSAEILIRALNSSRPILVDAMLSIVDIEDCTRGHIRAAELGEPGERYLLSGATVSVRDAVALLAGVASKELNPRWVPASVARVIGLPASSLLATLKPGSGVCPGLVRTLLHGHRFDGSRAGSELGFSYRDLSDTLSRTVAWLASEGHIDLG